jgi:hypothetical protein
MFKNVICSLVLLAASQLVSATEERLNIEPLASPYDVVVPLLNGDPASTDRVSGQLYFNTSSSAFKGVDSTGSLKTFVTESAGKGAKVTPPNPTLAGAAWGDISFTSSNSVYDTGSFIGTNQFVAQRTGIHLINAYGQNNSVSNSIGFRYRVNSGSWVQICSGSSNAGAYGFCSGSDQAYLTVADTIQFQVVSTDNNANTIRLAIAELMN